MVRLSVIKQVGTTNMKNFSYFLKEGVRSIFHHGFMSFATVSIILACLLMTGSVTLLSFNINLAINDLQAQSEIIVWVDENYTSEQARAMERELLAIENVASAVFESKDTALEQFREQLGDDARLLDDFDTAHNPLRDAYHITLEDVSLVRQTRSQIRQLDGVGDTSSSEDTIATLLRVQRVCQVISLVLIIALGAISIFIISNTVKLAMFSRRDEIAIMTMVGATNWFIRWPFVIEGLLLGLVGGGLAFFAEWGVYLELHQMIASILPAFEMVGFELVRPYILAIFLGVGVIVGIGGSTLSMRRFLDV